MMDMNFYHKGLYGKVNWLYSLAAVLLVDWHKVLAPSGNFSPQGEREGGVGRNTWRKAMTISLANRRHIQCPKMRSELRTF